MNLPKGFILGGATAAYQVEGATKEDGKGRICWDYFLEKEGRFLADPASDFYHKYEEDIKLAQQFGIKAIRISIAWSRIFPTGYGQVNQLGVDYYHKVFKACLDHDILPFVTLHHFDTPETLHLEGDWLNLDTVKHFVDFAKFCFSEYQEVRHWITINEPGAYVSGQYLTGAFPPGIKYRLDKAFQAQHHLNYAHALAVNAFKEGGHQGQIGYVHALTTFYPIDDSEESLKASANQDVLQNKFLLDGTFLGGYSADTITKVNQIIAINNQEKIVITEEQLQAMRKAARQLDFLGINYYQSAWVKACNEESYIHHNGTGDKGTSVYRLKGVSEIVHNPNIPTNDWDWYIYPEGLYDMLNRVWKDYPNCKEIYITENGIGQKEHMENEQDMIQDDERIAYVNSHLEYIAKAIQEDINVSGYFIWSLQDMFSWSNGYNKRYGLFYVDFETQKRYPKKSAHWYKQISQAIDSN